MFTHAFLGSNDLGRSRKFYDAVMGVLGYANVMPDEAGFLMYAGPNGNLMIGPPLDGQSATHGNGSTLGFAAKDDETVDAWHAAGVEAGGTCDGPPGPRERAPNNSRGAYLRDPDGNKICTFHISA